MYKDCMILSPLLKPPYSIHTDDYLDWLYDKYVDTYKLSKIMYRDMPIAMRVTPLIKDKDESFMHILCGNECKNVNEMRAQRLLWAKDIIENEPCTQRCTNCDKILTWRQGKKLKMYLKKYHYFLVLEERDSYWSFTTGYYVDNKYRRESLTKEYHEYKKQESKKAENALLK